jgi:Glycosyl transferase family 2
MRSHAGNASSATASGCLSATWSVWQAAAVSASSKVPASRSAVSVVIPTRDRAARLAVCLAAMRDSLRIDDELIVVDSASRHADAVADVAREAGARLLRCDQPGSDIARNVGWRAARHDVVLFTDDDVQVEPGWADALATAVSAHHEAGFVTGRVLASTGELIVAAAAPDAVDDGPRRRQRWSRDVAVKRDQQAETFTADSVGNLGHGANLGMRREVLERLGGWDEALGVGGVLRSAPEADVFDRCFALGLTGRYEPDAVALHEQWRGPRRVILLDARYGFGNGARIAKLVRTDPRRARLVARHAGWTWGLLEVWRGVEQRDLSRVVATLLRMIATVAGFGRAMTIPVVDGHFRLREQR